MKVPSTAEALSASVACARALGLPTDDPEVIAEGYSVRVHLRPAAVVTRVVTVGRELRPDPLPWLEREVSVAQFLAASGVPIVAPCVGGVLGGTLYDVCVRDRHPALTNRIADPVQRVEK